MNKRQKRRTCFIGQVQEMAAAQVTAHIGQDKMEVVRAGDEHPMFIGLKVAVEGFSTGELGKLGPHQKKWPGHTIEQLGWALNQGNIGLYDRHLDSQEPQDSREEVGTILSGFSQTPAGDGLLGKGLEAFAVGYVNQGDPREKLNQKTWDTCSIEAECLFQLDENGDWVVDSVQEVTGIALANSAFQQPGFPGASIVAVIQELEQLEYDAFLVANGMQPAAPAKPICTTDPFLAANKASADGQLQSP